MAMAFVPLALEGGFFGALPAGGYQVLPPFLGGHGFGRPALPGGAVVRFSPFFIRGQSIRGRDSRKKFEGGRPRRAARKKDREENGSGRDRRGKEKKSVPHGGRAHGERQIEFYHPNEKQFVVAPDHFGRECQAFWLNRPAVLLTRDCPQRIASGWTRFVGR